MCDGLAGTRRSCRSAGPPRAQVSSRSQLASVVPRRHRERRQVGRHQADRERALAPERGRPGHRAGVAVLEPGGHLGAGAQVRGARRAGASRRRRRGCAGRAPRPAPWPAGTAAGWRSAPRCWRSWAGPPSAASSASASLRSVSVGRPGVGELDGHVVGPEPARPAGAAPARRVAAARAQGLADRALAAAGERQHLARGVARPPRRGRRPGGPSPRPRSWAALIMRQSAAVALGVAGQQQQVAALRVGHAVLRGGEPERELGAEHRGARPARRPPRRTGPRRTCRRGR